MAAVEEAAAAAGALGTYVDDAGQLVVVFSDSQPFEFSAADVPTPHAPFMVVTKPLTWADANRVSGRLEELASATADATLRSKSWVAWLDPELGKVAVLGNVGSARMSALLGNLQSFVSYSEKGGYTELSTRHSDSSPFDGGGGEYKKVGSPFSFDCTTGYEVKDSSNRTFLVTAYHCQGTETLISPGTGAVIGSYWARSTYPTNDLFLIGPNGSGATYLPFIYVGCNACSTAYHVEDARDPTVGATGYCHDGAVSLLVCGQKVTSLTGYYCIVGVGCSAHDKILAKGPTPYVDHGDSGSPFFLPGAPGTNIAYIRGSISGYVDGDQSTLIAERWSSVANIFNVSIVKCGC